MLENNCRKNIPPSYSQNYFTSTSSMAGCKDCKQSIHLSSDSHSFDKEKLLSQTMCIFCWNPMMDDAFYRTSSVNLPPLIVDCGHITHLSCLERRKQLYKDTPTRCPMDGVIIKNIRYLHFLPPATTESGANHCSGLMSKDGK